MKQLNHAHRMTPVNLNYTELHVRGDLDEVKRLVEEKKLNPLEKDITMEILPFTSLLRVVTWT